jgi:DNA gyrase subunit B
LFRYKCIVNKDGSVTVKDNGRGIPVDVHKKEGYPQHELILNHASLWWKI